MASLYESESQPFLSQVERVRKEIKDKFFKSHQTLNEREAALLSELDQLVTSYKGEGVKEQIQELNLIKESMKFKVQRNENQETIVKSVAVMDDRISDLKLSLESTETRMRRVELEWDETLEEKLSEIGRIRIIGQLDYKEEREPVLTASPQNNILMTDSSWCLSPHSGVGLQQIPLASPAHPHDRYAGRLAITLAQCKLNKNYGLTRMDPYCRLSIGHGVYESVTDLNGAKNPKWNKCINITLPTGIKTLYIEIFDEKVFKVDERIAWSQIEIPAAVFEGQQVEDWFPLNGALGEEKEGNMLLGFKFEPMKK